MVKYAHGWDFNDYWRRPSGKFDDIVPIIYLLLFHLYQKYKREIILEGKVVFRTEILKSVVKFENLLKSINPQIR